MRWFSEWRRRRILGRAALDEDLWQRTLAGYTFLRRLAPDERERLREQVLLFLHEKSIEGAGGLRIHDDIRVAIAAQACILTLNLGLDYYRGWVEVIVYPDQFIVEREYVDEAGVVHRVREPLAGESWERGPVILSWADAGDAGGAGYNVVIHEFAHKIDMLNGGADGLPPLHADMSRAAWASAFGAAYEDMRARLARGEHTLIDPYAAEDPSEFFAVASEAFFEEPLEIRAGYPAVYGQLARFYRQDPAARVLPGAQP
jgi:Mlc titration factor MtfA (ptsG expression regulator)